MIGCWPRSGGTIRGGWTIGGTMKLVVDNQVIQDAAVSAAGVSLVLIILAVIGAAISA